MRKILLLSVFLTAWCAGHAQSLTITVTGTVTHSDNTPAAGVDIFISTIFNDSSFYFVTTLTNADGVYLEAIPVPNNQTEGVVSISAIGCTGAFDHYTHIWTSDMLTIVQDFVWCATPTTDTCFVLIVPSFDPATNTATLYALTTPNLAVTYLWSDGSTGQTLTVSDTGMYCVTITTTDGCSASSCYVYSYNTNDCYVTITGGNTGIANGVLFAHGFGAEPITYLWSTGESGQILNVMEAGTYCVTITDATGCTHSACYFYLPQPCNVWIGYDPLSGMLEALTIAESPVSFLWNTGETTQSIIPTDPGLYCVTIADAAGCTATACYDYTPFHYCDVVLTYSSDSTVGTPGNVLAATSYGTPPFSYLWSTGDATPAIMVDSVGPGICVTVTDAVGCVDSACTDDLLSYCYAWISVIYNNDGSATLTAYSYPLQGPLGSFVWNTGETTPSITVTTEGQYCVTFSVGNACSYTACAYVDLQNDHDSCYAYIIADQNPVTGTDSFHVIAFGTAPFAYIWSTGQTGPVIADPSPNATLCVTVTDATGCVTEACIIPIDFPCQVVINAYPVDSLSWSLTAMVFPPGPATFMWSNGTTTQTITTDVSDDYCVTVTTLDGCEATACVHLDIGSGIDTLFGPGVIHGYVFGQNQEQLSGIVELYRLADPATGAVWALIDSTDIEADNFYVFPDLPAGLYAVRAIVQSANGVVEYFPTYHYNAVDWQNANIISIPNFLTVLLIYDIYLVPTSVASGQGVITGSLSDPDGLFEELEAANRSSGIQGILIVLANEAGEPFLFTYTDPAGEFRFEDLPWGSYRIRFEYPGVQSPEVWVTLGPDRPAVSDVILTSTELSPTGTNDMTLGNLLIAPQPVIENCNVHVPDIIEDEHSLEIVTMNGQIIRSVKNCFRHEMKTSVAVDDLNAGIYLVQVRSGKSIRVGKMIKL